HQRPAGISGVDRSIGLDVVIIDPVECPARRRDDPRRHRLLEPKRTSQGDDPLTLLEPVRIAKPGKGQALRVDLDYGQVGLGIGTHPLGPEYAAIGQRNLHLVGVAGHVVIGKYVTIRAYYDSGTGAMLGPRLRHSKLRKPGNLRHILKAPHRRL